MTAFTDYITVDFKVIIVFEAVAVSYHMLVP